MNDFIELESIEKENPRDIGYHALTLGNLANAGLPVQQGFVISSKLMKEFVVASGIRERLFCLVRDGKKREITELIQRKTVPEVEEKILMKVKKSGFNQLFVQSSSVFKNHKFLVASVDKKGLIDAVKSCWASVFSSNLIEKLNSKNCFSAVIVQNNLGVRKAGFLYTQHPLWKKKSMVVEVNKPKHGYYLYEDGEVVHLREFPKLDMPLTMKEKELIGKLGKNVRAHLGEECKVNWVLSNRLYITGARSLESRDKDYFVSQVSSSELKSSS